MIEGDADAAPAKKRIFLFDREIGQRFIAADIQSSHGHGIGGKSLQLLAIDFGLLVFRRKTRTHKKWNFGAIETHTLGAAF